jgi:excisionase family DNA binding protein
MATETQTKRQAPGTPQPEGFITKKEVALRVKKTVRTIEHWQRKGILPYVKAGQSVLFKWADVERHLQRNFRVCRFKKPKRGRAKTPAARRVNRGKQDVDAVSFCQHLSVSNTTRTDFPQGNLPPVTSGDTASAGKI